MEQTQMVLAAASYLDEETILSKLPFVSVDEVQKIMKNAQAEADDRINEQEDEDAGYDNRQENV